MCLVCTCLCVCYVCAPTVGGWVEMLLSQWSLSSLSSSLQSILRRHRPSVRVVVTSLSRAASRCDHVPPGKHWPRGLTGAPLTPLQPCAVTVVTHLMSHPVRCRVRVAVLRPYTLSLSVLFRARSTGLSGACLLWGWRNCREGPTHTPHTEGAGSSLPWPQEPSRVTSSCCPHLRSQ